MKVEKYHIYLSTKERNEIVASLINLKNKLSLCRCRLLQPYQKQYLRAYAVPKLLSNRCEQRKFIRFHLR